MEKYTHEQLFFMSFAQLWCGKIQKEAAIEWLQTDQHSLYHGRVNLALINQKEFAKAFHCPIGSAMGRKALHSLVVNGKSWRKLI